MGIRAKLARRRARLERFNLLEPRLDEDCEIGRPISIGMELFIYSARVRAMLEEQGVMVEKIGYSNNPEYHFTCSLGGHDDFKDFIGKFQIDQTRGIIVLNTSGDTIREVPYGDFIVRSPQNEKIGFKLEINSTGKGSAGKIYRIKGEYVMPTQFDMEKLARNFAKQVL